MLGCCALIFASCQVVKNPPTPAVPVGKIDFRSLEAGQLSRYVAYRSECLALADSFAYTRDTLEVRVQLNEGKLFLEERFTEGSPMWEFNSTPVVHRIIQGADYVLIPDRFRSQLFFFYGNDTLRMGYENTARLKQNDCTLNIQEDPFTGVEIGYLPTFRVGPIELRKKSVVSCLPGSIIPSFGGAYIFHDDAQVYMSHTVTDAVRGWELLY